MSFAISVFVIQARLFNTTSSIQLSDGPPEEPDQRTQYEADILNEVRHTLKTCLKELQ